MIPTDTLFFEVPFGVGRTEAEDLSIKEGYKVQSNGAASGGATLKSTGPNSEVTGTFGGPAGTYDLTIGYFDETDGVSTLDVLVNGAVVDSFDWDSTAGSAIANAASLSERVISNIALNPGDVITLKGSADGGEPLRTDYIELAAAAVPPPPAVPSAFMIEAEDLTIVSGYKVQSNGAASGGAMLQDATLASGSSASPLATYTMAQTGVFDLTISYFDETDGESNLAVLLNDVGIDFFVWDGTGGSSIANGASLTTRTIEGVALSAGDVIGLQGFGDDGEPGRIDKLSFEPAVAPPPPPVGTSFVIEAEDLTIIDGFKVVSNAAASGGQTLQDDFETTASGAPVEARASYTMTQAGVFDLSVGVFDETDGVSSLRVLVNGIEVSNFVLDSLSGGILANSASATTLDVGPLFLEAGDVVEVAGFGDGREPLRIDFLEFETIVTPPPPFQQTEDIWYEDFNEVIVATSNGDGNFVERPTGIMVDGADILAGDFNGDNLIDFARIEAVGSPIILPTGLMDFPFEQRVQITVFTNDGSANFTAQPTQSVFFGVPGILAFSGQDVGDVDGDGDLDILAVGTVENGNFAFFFENNGLGTFSALATSNLSQGEFVQEALLADMDSDGNDDVIVFNGPDSSSVDVYLQDGAGNLTFIDSTSPSPESYGDGQIVDLDGDGDLDFIFSASGEGRGIYGYINDGTGAQAPGFGPSIFGDENGLIGTSVAADFDGDGDIEVVSMGAVDDDGIPEGLRVFDVVTDATGVDFVLDYTKSDIIGNAVAFGDFELDGDLDILFTPPNSPLSDPNLRILVNDGAGDFFDGGSVVPTFSTTDFSFAPIVGVEYFDDPLL